MTNYEDIKGADKLVNKYKEDFETINNSIEELGKRKQTLEEALDNSKDKFKLESIEKNAETKHSLNLINQYLKEAKQRKDELTKESKKNLVPEAKELVEKHVVLVKNKHNDINKKIIECLYQARSLQKELDRLEQQERQKINNFIRDLSPYFTDESEFRKTTGGRNQEQFITHEINARKRIFTTVPEAVYYVKGLTKPYLHARGEMSGSYSVTSEQDFNKFFGVDREATMNNGLEKVPEV